MKDNETGWVYTSVPLDFEKKSLYNLSVLAQDHGTRPNMASFEYRIKVKDVNEYEPTFIRSKYEFQILASLQVGENIGQVSSKLLFILSFIYFIY